MNDWSAEGYADRKGRGVCVHCERQIPEDRKGKAYCARCAELLQLANFKCRARRYLQSAPNLRDQVVDFIDREFGLTSLTPRKWK